MRLVTSLSRPDRQERLLESIKAIANTGQYANGLHLYKLQKHFQQIHDGAFPVAFNSCGSALFAAFRYYKSIGHKTVAMQNNTAYATGAMALEAGLNLHIIDSGPKCPSMSVDSLQSALDDDTTITLVCLTHTGGFIAEDYTAIANLCMDKNLPLIEDNANAVGQYASWSGPGKFAEVSCWSFSLQSSLPCGTGGMLITKDPEVRNFVRRFVEYGKYLDGTKIKYERGFNLGMSEYDAAVVLLHMELLPEILEARKRDWMALATVVPSLMVSECNYARYPIDSSLIQRFMLAPSMYAAGDQLAESLGKDKRVVYRNLAHSHRWALSHRCLPIGEGLYDGMNDKDILKVLSK